MLQRNRTMRSIRIHLYMIHSQILFGTCVRCGCSILFKHANFFALFSYQLFSSKSTLNSIEPFLWSVLVVNWNLERWSTWVSKQKSGHQFWMQTYQIYIKNLKSYWKMVPTIYIWMWWTAHSYPTSHLVSIRFFYWLLISYSSFLPIALKLYSVLIIFEHLFIFFPFIFNRPPGCKMLAYKN